MKSTDPFVDRMFSGFGHAHEVPVAVREQRSLAPIYHPLRQLKAEPGKSYRLEIQSPAVRVTAESPAIEVMQPGSGCNDWRLRDRPGCDSEPALNFAHAGDQRAKPYIHLLRGKMRRPPVAG